MPLGIIISISFVNDARNLTRSIVVTLDGYLFEDRVASFQLTGKTQTGRKDDTK